MEEIYINRLGLYFENKEQLKDYLKNHNNIFNKEELKEIVRIIYNNENFNDMEFNDIIYDYIIPKLKDLGVDMEYNEETQETNFERIMKENY